MKSILLIGAGFSKNWGGRLASEVWADVFTNGAVQARERVRKALLNERSFEVVMENTLTDPNYDWEDQLAISGAISTTFKRMDDLFASTMIYAIDKEVNYATLKHLIKRFSGSFIFSLNQDTLLEKLLQHWSVPFATPYVQQIGTAKIPDDRPASAAYQPDARSITLVKLHGSRTWINSEGVPLMVIGVGKARMIAGSWLLTEYRNIFEAALSSGSVRLMVMGYSFADTHINEIIATAASRQQCGVFVWNPNHPLDMLSGQKAILDGLIGWEPRRLADMMPATGVIRTADEGILSEFFG